MRAEIIGVHRARIVSAALLAATVTLTLAAAPGRAAPVPAGGATSAARGHWDVQRVADGRWQVSWTSPTRLPIRSDRPTITTTAGTALGVPTTAADGRTVRTVVVAPGAPDLARLEVVLSGTRLDRTTPATRRSVPAASRPSAAATTPLAADPGVPGPYAVTSSDYVRPSVKIAGIAQPIEMVGHVVEPAADAPTGPRPLVLFLHGRHEYCYQSGPGQASGDWPCRAPMREVPSQLGYDYVQRLLASQGYATVSIRVNGINAQDAGLADSGASARATMIQRHLDYWSTIAAAHQVDLSRVVLVGHSRGGEGVDRASIRIPGQTDKPYRIAGQVLVAPTDFAFQTAPGVPTVTLLPYCDGDVSDLEGQNYTDIARDTSADDHSLKSSVLIMGANHNFFNTEWTPTISQAPSTDDWSGDATSLCGTRTPQRLTAPQQRAVGQAYIAGAVALFTDPATTTSLLPMFDGSPVSVRSAGSAVVHTHALGGDRVLRRPGRDSTLLLPDGADSTFCTGTTSYDYRPGTCGSEVTAVTPHWTPRDAQPVATRSFWQLAWTARGQSAGLQLTRALDLRSRRLDLRTIVDLSRGTPAIRLRLADMVGRTATLTPEGGGAIAPLPASPPDDWEQVGKLWAQDVRVDPAPAAGDLDLAHIASVTVVGQSARGRLWIADLATTAGTLPAPTATRVPALSIGAVTVPEGDAEGTSIARVPFRLSRPMDRPGRFSVYTVAPRPGSQRLFTVDLAPGQQTGTIPVGYQADDLDSPARTVIDVAAGAGRNVMTDHYLGKLTVLDDDPTPRVTITRARTQVAEGGQATWVVTLSRPVGYELPVSARVVAGPGRDLTGADVPASWLEFHAQREGPTSTLAGLGVLIESTVRTGERRAVLTIPVRRDGRTEPAEAVTLRIRAAGTTTTSTVGVRAS